MSSDQPNYGHVKTSEFAEALRKEMPDVYVVEGGGPYEMHVGLRIDVATMLYAVNEEHAELMLQAAAEQLKVRTMRGLGLDRIINAYDAEARELRVLNQQLSEQLKSSQALVGKLTEQLDDLLVSEEPYEDDED